MGLRFKIKRVHLIIGIIKGHIFIWGIPVYCKEVQQSCRHEHGTKGIHVFGYICRGNQKYHEEPFLSGYIYMQPK